MMKRKMMMLIFVAVTITAIMTCYKTQKIELYDKYDDGEINIEFGTPVSEDVSDYVDFDKVDKNDTAYVKNNTVIKYSGSKVMSGEYDKVGKYDLSIIYCGREYKKIKVNVRDTVKPEFTKNEDMTVGLDEEADYADMFSAFDLSKITMTYDDSKVKINQEGDYKITANAEDESGNKSAATAVLHVKENGEAEGTQSGETYIYVNIDEQKMTYYEKGTVKLQCDVVTGDVKTGQDTPAGTYSVTEKKTNITLHGDDFDDYVQYWIGFIGSMYGLHDASWRDGTFGSDIYKTNGSHGCVNMPTDTIKELYGMVEIGTKVVIE